MSIDDPAGAIRSTLEHAAQCHAKAQMLLEQSAESMRVAESLVSHHSVFLIPADTISDLLDFTRAAAIPGRRPVVLRLETALHSRIIAQNIFYRHRSSTGTPWPITPGTPCVYMLIDADQHVIYIGQSVNLQARIGGHRGKKWAAVQFVVCGSLPEAKELEADLIFQHQPALNTALKAKRVKV